MRIASSQHREKHLGECYGAQWNISNDRVTSCFLTGGHEGRARPPEGGKATDD